jgi:thiamine biosynthesis protein ThiS
MRLTINGETREVPPVRTLSELIAALSLDTRKVAIEQNLEIVPRSLHAKTAVAEGDRIEIVHFIGGG